MHPPTAKPPEASGEQSKRQLREAWLQEAVDYLVEFMEAYGLHCPPVRVSCGFPSKNGLSTRSRIIGECFASEACTDGIPQLFVSPVLADSVEVLGTLLHELLHAAVGCEHGHGRTFSQAARSVGLAGKPTATTVGAALRIHFEEYIQRADPYPHAAIRISGHKQSTAEEGEEGTEKPRSRLRLYECYCIPPVKVRVARDDFKGLCLACNHVFKRPASQ